MALARKSHRKLAAVLMADVAEYSRMVRADEAATLAEVKKQLSDVVRPAIRRHDGKLIKLMGDGILALFDSPVNAVRCAVAMQEGAALRNAGLGAARQLHLHIGINLGDVVVEKNDVFGDAVNVASRMQGIAGSDCIVISDAVAVHIGGKVDVTLRDLGPQKVKNIAEPIRAWCAETSPQAGTAAPLAGPAASQEAATQTPAIAVLPFVNMSGDPEQRYYSDGITEDIITELSRFRTLQVIARTSSFAYRGEPMDVKKVGAELNAQFVVEGSVRKLGERIRITVQLVNARDRTHVWAEKYDAALSELFAVQDELTHRIVATLVPRLEAEELERARRQPHLRAYDCYLRGKELYYASQAGDVRDKARGFFEEAIAIDPEFARAYCFLSAIENNATAAAGAPLEASRERAREFALKAVALDGSDPLTHLAVAWSHLWRGEFDAAAKHLESATRLNPNDAERAMDRGTTLMYLGKPEEAVEVMRGAMRLDPVHNDAWRADLAEALFAAHRYDEMLGLAAQLPFRSAKFEAWMAAGCAHAGRLEEARRHAGTFVSGVRAMWAGAPDAGEPEYVAWVLSLCPFRRSEDVAHLLDGLARAGLRHRG